MLNTEHILNVEQIRDSESEEHCLQSHNKQNNSIPSINNLNNKQARVTFYCPFNQTFTTLEKYESAQILNILKSYDKGNFFIIQIDDDYNLYQEILKMQFKSEFENIHKMFDLKLDYCFSPVDELLCFNLSVLTNIDYDEVEKYLIQIFFSENGLYIINKDCCDSILNIFRQNFNFKEICNDNFFDKLNKGNIDGIINNTNLAAKQFKVNQYDKKQRGKRNSFNSNNEIGTKRLSTNFNTNIELPSINSFFFKTKEDENNKNINEEKDHPKSNSTKNLSVVNEEPNFDGIIVEKLMNATRDFKPNRQNRRRCALVVREDNFSTDDLIYYLLTLSLNKLEEYSESLIRESESLKEIYMELSEKERKDFFRRIHNMEVSLQLILQETLIKKKFLKYSKAQFIVYNKLSNNFYFKNTFNFFVELMISKVSQLEIVFEKLDNTIKMIKENYSIIIEDNTEKQNKKLNSLMKVLAIITTIYAPLNIIPNMFGMNVKVPWQNEDSLWPFFGILMFAISLVVIEMIIFRRLKWL